jgi:KamA family protein
VLLEHRIQFGTKTISLDATEIGKAECLTRRYAITRLTAKKYRAYAWQDIDKIPQLRQLSQTDRLSMMAVAQVFPFRANNHVVDELIDWSNIPGDPIYQLTFPQPAMLEPKNLARMLGLIRSGTREEMRAAARKIQVDLNPHPAGQLDMNVPRLLDQPVPGLQHKYEETVLFFPAPGQTCHAYCTYCFRWPQFAGLDGMRFASRQTDALVEYLKVHKEVTSVLITGGDPLVMKTSLLRRFVEPLLDPALEHVASIRIGTKALAYWPYRFLTQSDSADLLRLFEEVRESGRHLALMAHFSHPRELEPAITQHALRAVRDSGATIRCQAPIVRHVNDSVDVWTELWKHQVRLGAVPYYMFVERNTGPNDYFAVPLLRAEEVYRKAFRQVSGLARTVRGPSMSANPGKVLIIGTTYVYNEEVLVLRFIQARNPNWVGKPFFARYDEKATWFTDLKPALGEKEFFFEKEFNRMVRPCDEERVAECENATVQLR